MPILTLPIESAGDILTVGFAVSEPRQAAMKKAGLPIPPLVFARGLVDTGASCTCVDPTVVQKLQLEPSGTTQMLTPSTGATPHICSQFDVAVAIVMDARQVHVCSLLTPVVESDLSPHGIQALIGRDVLDRGILIYDGCRRQIALAF